MKKTIFVLMVAVLLLASLVLVPQVRAAYPAQGGGHSDPPPVTDPNAQHLVEYTNGTAPLYGNGGNGGGLTIQEMQNSISPRDSMPQFDASPSDSGPITQPLDLADGPAKYTPGYGIAGSHGGDVLGTVAGSSSTAIALTAPFPFASTGANIPVLIKPIVEIYYHNTTYGCTGLSYCNNSGVVITSGSGGNDDLILTEAYALKSTAGVWSTDFYVYPQDAYGVAPYGFWTATNEVVSPGWAAKYTKREDFGLIVTDDSSNPCGQTGSSWGITMCVGAMGVAWNQPYFQQFWFIGYPVPGSSGAPWLCNSSTGNLWAPDSFFTYPMHLLIGCDQGYRMDGGPLIIGGKFANKGFAAGVGNYDAADTLMTNTWSASFLATDFGTMYLANR